MLSVVFDIVFIVQHYVLYKHNNAVVEAKRDAEQPLLAAAADVDEHSSNAADSGSSPLVK